MKNKYLSLIVLGLSIGFVSQHSIAKSQATLRQCQYIQDKIEYYTDLRRSGGSARTMENWKRKRNYYEDKFGNQNCKKWNGKLN